MRSHIGLWIAAAISVIVLALIATVGVVALTVSGSNTGFPWRIGTGSQGLNNCSLPQAPGTLVTYTAVDMGMGGSMMGGGMGTMSLTPRQTSVTAGQVTIELRNMGTRPHELLVFPLTKGQQPGARPIGADDRISEDGVLGEVQPVCPPDPGIDGTPPGGVSRTTLNMTPGSYEIVCNLPGHYRHGMYALLTVT